MSTSEAERGRLAVAERGSLTVTDRALAHLSEYAAQEAMNAWGGPSRRARVRLRKDRRAALARIEVPYPYPASTAADEVKDHLARRLATLADTQVRDIAITVSYTAPGGKAPGNTVLPDRPSDEPEPEPEPVQLSATRPLPRARRVPAAVAVLIIGAASALALIAVIQQRYRRPGSVEAWVKSVADATPADAAVTVCAAALVLFGLVFLGWAVMPNRERLAMQTSEPCVHATVSNGGVAAFLRGAVPGLRTRAKAGARKDPLR